MDNLTAKTQCPYCGEVAEFEVKYEVNRTIEWCDKCEKFFAIYSEVEVTTTAYKVEDMNE
ncbi:hypothetical protein LCGC14_1037230 [marine sediment metagenome]|uniref:Uncharacterized protein n=1 Tax=marine sediment metagenome TaxID=412755 RepID=A0A0F9NEG1_9ZZZZ